MELEFIRWLNNRIAAHPGARLGIGDDAALLEWADRGDCVVTSDLLMDGAHFRLEAGDPPKRIGHKALAVNLSDLAAMASRPVAAFVSLALPRNGGLPLAQDLVEGMLPLAEQFQVAIAGGDTNIWGGPLVISVTAVGMATEHGVLRRDGGRPGDWLLVTGALGGSLLGRHLDVEPRVAEALVLNDQFEIHACLDISDGLALDLSRLASASGCGAILEAAAIPVSDAARQLAQRGDGRSSPLDHALSDGEDFELLFSVAPDVGQKILAAQPLAVPIRHIGELTDEPQLWLRREDATLEPLAARGFEHQ
ncbi:MAG: thiamine-phosphate kinase [Planctomycetales bacterium]|nr:thiamine-phosphate kinase [Planctomycetales bacterium]